MSTFYNLLHVKYFLKVTFMTTKWKKGVKLSHLSYDVIAWRLQMQHSGEEALQLAQENHLYHPISVYWLNFLLTLVLPLPL